MKRHAGYRYYDFVMAAFVTVLICSNLIGPVRCAEHEDYYDVGTDFNPFLLRG